MNEWLTLADPLRVCEIDLNAARELHARVVAEGPLGPGVDVEAARASGEVVAFFGKGSPFSNFATCRLYLPGPDGVWRTYRTNEHYFAAYKTLDLAAHEEIRTAPRPQDAKALGREVELREGWDAGVGLVVMLCGLQVKFAGVPYRSRLESTGARPIAEDAPADEIWGIRARDGSSSWTGTNLLGRSLMMVRSVLPQLDRPTP